MGGVFLFVVLGKVFLHIQIQSCHIFKLFSPNMWTNIFPVMGTQIFALSHHSDSYGIYENC